MNQFSKFFVSVTVLLYAFATSAGTLYWQVNEDDGSGDYITAQLYAQQGNNAAFAISGEYETPTGPEPIQTDISAYDDGTYLFFVELRNYNAGTETSGYKWGYGDLISSGYVAVDARDIPRVMASAGAHSNFAAAPEPSSGLLLLMGGAMLALRRRRQK